MKVCICAHLCNRYLHPYLRIRVGMKHVELLAYVHRSCLQVAIVMMMIMMHMWEGRLSLLGTSNKSPDNSIDSTLEPLQPF